LGSLEIGPTDPWIAFQPGRYKPEATWSEDKFVALAEKLGARFRCPILIFEGPVDRTPIARNVRQRLGAAARLVPALPIRQYAAVLQQCALLIVSEGGAGHIAAALGVKTIVLFTTPTVSYWFPYTRAQGMIALEEHSGKDLSVERVFSAAEALWL
jgi:ADP-heptose:LPS heptosyltransferase